MVRSRPIGSSGFCSPSPRGSRARNLEPSSVAISIDAVVRLPTQASSTVNSTFTWSPSRETFCTRPASTPATVTRSLACRPAASGNSAV
ncbi:hypothetical protein WY02_12570 [Pseudonocardia sp. AL041005-10]|nr:hypothetical protein WY02_12570 [Pseudonocardia sp. AL041005-10]